MLAYAKQRFNIANAEKAVQSAKMLPDLSVGYFNLSQIGSPTASGSIAGASNRFTGIQAGISIPLFYGSYKASIKSAKLREQWHKPMPTITIQCFKVNMNSKLQEVMKYQGQFELLQRQERFRRQI